MLAQDFEEAQERELRGLSSHEPSPAINNLDDGFGQFFGLTDPLTDARLPQHHTFGSSHGTSFLPPTLFNFANQLRLNRSLPNLSLSSFPFQPRHVPSFLFSSVNPARATFTPVTFENACVEWGITGSNTIKRDQTRSNAHPTRVKTTVWRMDVCETTTCLNRGRSIQVSLLVDDRTNGCVEPVGRSAAWLVPLVRSGALAQCSWTREPAHDTRGGSK